MIVLTSFIITGGAFYYFTEGAFINTNHYKGSWGDVSWRDIGIKKFYDGFKVPYYETEGRFPFIDNDNFTAVAIKLKVYTNLELILSVPYEL